MSRNIEVHRECMTVDTSKRFLAIIVIFISSLVARVILNSEIDLIKTRLFYKYNLINDTVRFSLK